MLNGGWLETHVSNIVRLRLDAAFSERAKFYHPADKRSSDYGNQL
jgi:hypothetical protein